MRTLFQGSVLAGQLLDLSTLSTVFNLQLVKVCLGSDGRRVRFAERGGKRAVLLCGQTDLFLECLLCGFGICKALRIIVLAVIAFLQFGIGGSQRLLVLCDCVLLKLQPAFQRR